MSNTPSRADRLHAIIAKVNPAAAAQHAKDGSWPKGSAPYVLGEINGKAGVRVIGPDGDTVSGNGATLGAAIDALATKVGLQEGAAV